MPCTTLLVGKKASYDGTTMTARNEDSGAGKFMPKKMVVVHPELGIIPPILMLGLAVLLGFYFYHYFFLENTVQRWYKIYDNMVEKLHLL